MDMLNSLLDSENNLENKDKTLEEELEYNKEQSRLLEIRNYHKEQYSNPYKREVIRLETLIELEKFNIHIDDYEVSGQIIINNKFVYALLSGRWRIKGKNTWYWSKDPKHFVENYVFRNKEKNMIRSHVLKPRTKKEVLSDF